jgi:Spy/CpxP family protein refolding chaperone
MSMNKPWQVCLVLIAIFAAGGISGGLVAYRVARRNAARLPTPEAWMARRFDQMARELSLTPAQQARIEPMLKRDIDELFKLRRQWFRTSREILERKEAEIAAELTPEQRTKYEQFLKERRERIRRMTPEGRGPRGPSGADDEPPPPPNPTEKSRGT